MGGQACLDLNQLSRNSAELGEKAAFPICSAREALSSGNGVGNVAIPCATDNPRSGSGTTAYVAEQWGRRWITIDTSRVALALARARIMGARYLYYLLADSPEGQRREAEVSRTPPKEARTHNDIRQGFVYDRIPHVMLEGISKNAEIDVKHRRKMPRRGVDDTQHLGGCDLTGQCLVALGSALGELASKVGDGLLRIG
jgi:hypothetical protein